MYLKVATASSVCNRDRSAGLLLRGRCVAASIFLMQRRIKNNQMTCVRHPFDIVFYLWIT
jgi:hypothetical protein